MRKFTGIILIIAFVCTLTTPTSSDPFLEHIYNSSHFDIFYTDDFESDPLHAVSSESVEAFAAILEEVRSRQVDDFGYKDPYMRLVKVLDQGGINARGGYWGMKLDPFFLDVIDLDANRSASEVEKYAVALHEYQHVIQYHYFYHSSEARKWILEGHARLLQDKLYDFIDTSGDHFAGYFGEVNGYLGNPNRNLLKSSYAACLFWNYVAEQFGDLRDEPSVGVDSLVEYWETAGEEGGWDEGEIRLFNHMLDNNGHPEVNFADVFANFAATNYLKDVEGNTDPRYTYLDEQQEPGKYKSVKLRLNQSMTATDSKVGTDYVFPYGSQYYNIRFEGGDNGTKETPYPVNIRVGQITSNELIFNVITVSEGGFEVDQYFGKDLDITKTFYQGQKIVLVVSSLGASSGYPTKYHYAINANQDTFVNILSPLGDVDSHRAKAGIHHSPEKITVTLNVFDNDLEVLRGIPRTDFHVAIGGIPANVTTAHEEFGMYFMNVMAPPQPVDGKYNLTVSYGASSVTEPEAVLYSDRGSDIVTVVDGSGSMRLNAKLDAAKIASSVYLDSTLENDTFGIVFFDEDAKFFAEGLFPISTYRNALLENITSIKTSPGGTSVGDGIFTANDFLYRFGDPLHDKIMIVLSDGRENEPLSISDVHRLLYTAPNATVAHAVLIGEDANGGDLDTVSRNSGGLVQYAFDNTTSGSLLKNDLSRLAQSVAADPAYPITSELTNIYRVLVEESTREERIYANQGFLGGTGWEIAEKIQLDTANTASFVFSYRAENSVKPEDVILVTPSGSKLTPERMNEHVGYDNYCYGYLVWKLASPDGGQYSLTTTGDGEVEFFVEAAIRSPLTLTTRFPLPDSDQKQDYRITGCEFPIIATLSDETGPIVGAEVHATITKGESYEKSQSWQLKLYDDGRHGDGYSNDGVYANNFTRTRWSGLYRVEVEAVGKTTLGDQFVREDLQAFYLKEDLDYDGDGLPHFWEIRHSLDDSEATGKYGPDGDPDNDGLTNMKELTTGTNPRLVDTDSGGESDSSEVSHGRDPYFSEDDNLFPPEIDAIPGDTEATISFSNRTIYDVVHLARSNDLTVGFTVVASNIDADTLSNYTDTGLTNGLTYFYRMQAEASSGEVSGWSEIVEVTPREDYEQPEGWVLINGGDRFTSSRDVTILSYVDPDVTHMRLAQESSFEGVAWQPYEREVSFTLHDEGLQTVYVMFKDAAGNTGGHDSGAYAFDGIVVDPDYIPPLPTSTSTTTTTTNTESNVSTSSNPGTSGDTETSTSTDSSDGTTGPGAITTPVTGIDFLLAIVTVGTIASLYLWRRRGT